MVSTEIGLAFLIGFASGAAAATGIPTLLKDWRDAKEKRESQIKPVRWDG